MRLRTPQAFMIVAALTAGGTLAACGSSGGTEATLAPVTTAPTTSIGSTTTSTTIDPDLVMPTLAPGQPLPVLKPFSSTDEKKAETEVVIGKISIPAIGLNDMTVYLGYSIPTYNKGVGLWPGAPKPGQAGNVVLGGHRTSGPRPFRRVDELKAGDEIIVTTSDGTFVYAVESVQAYPASEAAGVVLAQTTSARMTIFACHPPGKTTHRIVVFATYVRKQSV